MIQFQRIGAACDIIFADGARVWCPPKFCDGLRSLDLLKKYPAYTIDRPYWTSGNKCPEYCAGPLLTNEEIEVYVIPFYPSIVEKGDSNG